MIINQNCSPITVCQSDEESILKTIEKAGRTCYRSEDKIDNTSSIKFFKMIIKRGHTSVLEHSNICYFTSHKEKDTSTNILTCSKSFEERLLSLYENIGDDGSHFRIRTINGNKIIIAGNVRGFRNILRKRDLPYDAKFLKTRYPALFKDIECEELDESVDLKNFYSFKEKEQLFETLNDNELDLPMFLFTFITDRGITHEIVRHRSLQLSQESTRYVNYKDKEIEFISPNIQINNQRLPNEWKTHLGNCSKLYNNLIEKGWSPQFARSVLPNSLSSKITVSGRLSAWKHFIKLRTDRSAHPQIQWIARCVKDEFSALGFNF